LLKVIKLKHFKVVEHLEAHVAQKCLQVGHGGKYKMLKAESNLEKVERPKQSDRTLAGHIS
jgi:hypothetical protein